MRPMEKIMPLGALLRKTISMRSRRHAEIESKMSSSELGYVNAKPTYISTQQRIIIIRGKLLQHDYNVNLMMII